MTLMRIILVSGLIQVGFAGR